MSDYLPLDAIRLIDIGARLSSRPLVENRSRRIKDTKQLVNRSITNAAKLPRKTGSILGDEINRYSMIDSYSLSRLTAPAVVTQLLVVVVIQHRCQCHLDLLVHRKHHY